MKKTVTVTTLSGKKYTYELASFGQRLGARIIDVLIIFIPNTIIPIIPAWLYWSLQHNSLKQATIGQKTCKIKIVDTMGRPISFGKATGRFFGNYLCILTMLIGYFMFFFNDKQQCLHDYLAGTYVVNDQPLLLEDDIIDHLIE